MPEQIALTDDWIVVNKPAGWLTIPGRSESPVLSAWVEERHGKPWTVHRIDLETSGVVLFARNEAAHRRASLWFQNHEVKKSYDCLASGVPAAPVLKIRSPIEGAPATTQIEVRERFDSCFFAVARPVSGKRHQIRIHLASMGYPLLGDSRYQGPIQVIQASRSIAVPRVALHARVLTLPSGEVFEAPWPEDFQGWMGNLRGN